MRCTNIFSALFGFRANAKFNDSVDKQQEVSSFRRYLPQILASSAKNLLIVDFGLSIAFATILIPALTGLNNALNPNETLTITPDQVTWLASSMMIAQPFGSLASGFLTEPLGRKRALICVNLPYAIGWVLLYYADTLATIYAAFTLLGLGIGLMEAPIFTYIGEICEPNIRGMLTASASIAAAFGMALVYFLGNMTSWRNAALICMTIPVIAMVLISFCPETPLWLLSRNRQADALKSLQWLRGWTTEDAVRAEFEDLQRCRITAQQCYECEKQNAICTHPPPTISAKIRDLLRQRTIRPFILIGCLYFLSGFAGHSPYRPYMVQVLYYYKSPIDANTAVAWIGYVGFVSNIILVMTIRSIGKRAVYLWSMALIVLISFALGIYGFIYLPNSLTSFDLAGNSRESASATQLHQYLPLIAFNLLQFLSNFGINAIPNMMMCEVFPFKSKAFATGLVTIVYYFSMFLSSKTFYLLEVLFTLPGVGLFYGFVGLIGLIGMYLVLPETEGRTLEDIEAYFSDRKRKLCDIHIPSLTNTS